MRLCRFVAIATMCLLAIPAVAFSDGDTDPAFGSNGLLLVPRATTFGASTVMLGALAPASDGGFWWTMQDADDALLLGKRQANGSVGATVNGDVPLRFTACVGNGSAGLLPTEDGGVLLWTGRCLMRRLADGSPDLNFGTAGSVDVGILKDGQIARDGVGRIVLAGDDVPQWRVRRFLANGQLDTGYASNGLATPTIPSTNGFAGVHALALRPDGSAVVGGYRGNTHGPNLVLFGLRADGNPDEDFGVAGLVDVDAPAGFSHIIADALLAVGDGDVWVGGHGSDGGGNCCMLIARYDRHGVRDAGIGLRTFQLGGADITPFFEMRTKLARAPHGGVWIGMNSFPLVTGHRTQFTLVRLRANGTLDTGFGGSGWRNWFINHPVTGNPSGDYIQLHDMLIRDGRALLFGRTFFEDDATPDDYLTYLQLRFETVFADGMER